MQKRRPSIRGLGTLLRREIDASVNLPVFTRLRGLRSGFNSSTLLAYQPGASQSLAEYVSDLDHKIRCGRINRPFENLLNDKLLFGFVVRQFAPTPQIVAVIKKGRLAWRASDWDCAGTESLVRSAQTGPGLVFRPMFGKKGRGLLVIRGHAENNAVTLNGSEVPMSLCQLRLEHNLAATDYVVTEFVEQGQFGKRIYPRVTNTIRIVTMIDPSTDKAFLPVAVHRFGTSKSAPADNWSQGGLSASIDVETGCLSAAAAAPQNGPPVWYDHHPDSGRRISGEHIPDWGNIAKAIQSLAQGLSFLPYVGWDVLQTDEGFTVIEGNHNMDVNLLQVHRPLLSNERVRQFYEYHGVVA